MATALYNHGYDFGDTNIPPPSYKPKFSSFSVVQKTFTDPGFVWTTSDCTLSYSTDYLRRHNRTLKVIPGDAAAQIRKSSITTILADPVDKMLTINVYLPFIPVSGGSGHSINVVFYAVSGNFANQVTFTFDSGYLRQGWNQLRCYHGDTNGAAGTGTLAAGAGKSVGGTGCDISSAIGYIEVNFTNMTGLSIYMSDICRSAKLANIPVVMGFDATGYAGNDENFITHLIPLFAQYNMRPYFTQTSIYDMDYQGSSDEVRKRTLYNNGWSAINHTTNHGASKPGATQTVTLSRTSNLVTVTGVFAATGYTVGEKFYAAVYGSGVTDMNGVFEMTVVSTTTVTYTAAGADGAGSGTITFSTMLKDVINAVNATSTMLADHEIVDCALRMRGLGYTRGANVGAWPNNSCPELTTTIASCQKAGIIAFRGISGGSPKVDEFGIDNPYHFGSYEMGSAGTATTTQGLKDKYLGCKNRGEPFYTYGHYVEVETASTNLGFAPGQGGNPNPPLTNGGYGGFWYVGQIRLLLEYIAPDFTSGLAVPMTAEDFAVYTGAI